MKKNLFALPFMLVLIGLQLSGCVKDIVTREYTFYRPVYKTKTEVRSQIKSQAARTLQQPGKIYYKDGYLFVSELDKGVHIIDVRNAATPQIIGFVAIPGCVDLAVRGNTLYADMYTDLVAVDISNPAAITLQKVVEGVFPHRLYDQYQPDQSLIITDWVRVDTVVRGGDQYKSWGIATAQFDALSNSGNRSGTTNGTGGSMARFALAGSHLYTVSHADLKTFNVATATDPRYVATTTIGNGWGIETIFPYKNNLFIGSQNGMYIVSLAQPDKPALSGTFDHARVCDPVVANDNYAYVTLRDGTVCQGFINQLDVVDISNLSSPKLLSSYSMTNPHGLGNDGTMLLVCDGRDGLKILDVSNPRAVKQISRLSMPDAYDVIPLGGLALVLAGNGLHLVDYTNATAPVVMGRINISPKL